MSFIARGDRLFLIWTTLARLGQRIIKPKRRSSERRASIVTSLPALIKRPTVCDAALSLSLPDHGHERARLGRRRSDRGRRRDLSASHARFVRGCIWSIRKPEKCSGLMKIRPSAGTLDEPRGGATFDLYQSRIALVAYTFGITGREQANKTFGHRWLRDNCAPALRRP
jgi:hypothetical protein